MSDLHKVINVTKTFLPPFEEYQEYLERIWQHTWLTNQGPLLLELEKQLQERFDSPNVHALGNGTLALQVALRALDIAGGDIITTPFSYVATTSSILWERCRPVFVDIEPSTFCIDPAKIEAAITPKTKAIMPVHVFGNACDIEKIDAIAKKYKLKVIYDAAHAFGVTYKGKSLFSYGDISIGSFHSTKLFHTIEGGCAVVKDKLVSDKLELIKRFGHHGDEHFMLGINAKMNEFEAAMGLCNLKYVDEIVAKRKATSELYDRMLGAKFGQPSVRAGTTRNYGYYPIVLKDEAQLHEVVEVLNADNIFPRRYFYPSLNKLPYIQAAQACPVSERIASSILCLPLSHELEDEDVRTICKLIKSKTKGDV